MGRLLIGYWLLALGCWQSSCLAAQDSLSTAGFGLLFDSAAYEALPLLSQYDGRKGEGEAPRQVSLRPWCPPPLNQGATGACTGFAAGYGAMTILEAIRQDATLPEAVAQLACSPWFLYNQIKQPGSSCSAPANTCAALNVLKEQGICLLSEFNTPGNCQKLPPPEIKASAASRRLSDYLRLFESGAAPEGKIAAVRDVLAGGMPVVADIKMYDSFLHRPPRAGYWRRSSLDNYQNLQHALLVVGYDDRQETFELMSSWGKQWADGGFVRVSYQDFAFICLGAYALIPYDFQPPALQEAQPALTSTSTAAQPEKRQPAPATAAASNPAAHPKAKTAAPSLADDAAVYLQGIFEFGRPVENAAGNFDFQPEPVRYDPLTHLYSTVQIAFPVGTMFQLRSTDIPAGKHAYVFSCDPTGKVQLHFPKSERHAAFVPGSHALITIPSKDSALQINHPGDDFLCIVYSEDAIPDIRERLALLKGYAVGDFHERLQTAFAGLLVEPGRVRCEERRIRTQFSGVRKEGTAMGVVLRVRCGG